MLTRRRALPSSTTEIVYPLGELLLVYRMWGYIIYVDVANGSLGNSACLVNNLERREVERYILILLFGTSQVVADSAGQKVDEVGEEGAPGAVCDADGRMSTRSYWCLFDIGRDAIQRLRGHARRCQGSIEWGNAR